MNLDGTGYKGRHRRKDWAAAAEEPCTCVKSSPGLSSRGHDPGCPVREESDTRLRIGHGGVRAGGDTAVFSAA